MTTFCSGITGQPHAAVISERTPASFTRFPDRERGTSRVQHPPLQSCLSPMCSRVHVYVHTCMHLAPCTVTTHVGLRPHHSQDAEWVQRPRCPSVTMPTPVSLPGSLVTLNCSPSLYCCHFKNVTHVQSHSTGRVDPAFLIQHPLRVS